MLSKINGLMRFRTARRRGVTLVEAFVAFAAFAGVAAFTVGVVVLAGRQSGRSLRALPAESNTFRLMDRVRYEVLSAQAGRIYIDSNNPRELVFWNSSRGTRSRLFFDDGANNAANRGVWLQIDTETNSDPVRLGNSLDIADMTFQVDNFGRHVQVRLHHNSKNSKNKDSKMVYEEWLTARN